jgi:hypothetical protein
MIGTPPKPRSSLVAVLFVLSILATIALCITSGLFMGDGSGPQEALAISISPFGFGLAWPAIIRWCAKGGKRNVWIGVGLLLLHYISLLSINYHSVREFIQDFSVYTRISLPLTIVWIGIYAWLNATAWILIFRYWRISYAQRRRALNSTC